MGALRCARAAIPHLQASGWGRIVNISGLNAPLETPRIAGPGNHFDVRAKPGEYSPAG